MSFNSNYVRNIHLCLSVIKTRAAVRFLLSSRSPFRSFFLRIRSMYCVRTSLTLSLSLQYVCMWVSECVRPHPIKLSWHQATSTAACHDCRGVREWNELQGGHAWAREVLKNRHAVVFVGESVSLFAYRRSDRQRICKMCVLSRLFECNVEWLKVCVCAAVANDVGGSGSKVYLLTMLTQITYRLVICCVIAKLHSVWLSLCGFGHFMFINAAMFQKALVQKSST